MPAGWTSPSSCGWCAPATANSGPNPEYVLETASHLQAMGIRDRHLDEWCEVLGGIDVPVAETA